MRKPIVSINVFGSCFLCCIIHINGHGYIYWPTSRNYLKGANDAQSNNSPPGPNPTCPDCGFSDYKSKHGAPPDTGKTTSATAWAWSLCGDGPNTYAQPPGASWKDWGGPPVATYQEGGDMKVIMVVNAEHGGAHQFRLCTKKLSSAMSAKEAAACLDEHLIATVPTPGEACGYKNDRCKSVTKPGSDASDPMFEPATSTGAAPPRHMLNGAHVWTFKLPKGVSCEECTVQWYWATAYGEWFRGCMDIKIEGTGGGPSPPEENDNNDDDDSARRRSPPRRRSDRRRSPPRRRSDRRRSPPRRRSARRRSPPRRRSARRRTPRRRSARRRTPRRRSQRRRTPRRRSSPPRRRSQRRRAPSDGRRRSPSSMARSQNAVNSLPDVDYQKWGCFPLADGDAQGDHTLRDLTCMEHNEGSSCRSGLPFFRFTVEKTNATRLCFSFCASKGADIFGVLGVSSASAVEAECRCGASVTNYKFWSANGLPTGDPHPSLLLDPSAKTKECTANSVHVYDYNAWKRDSASNGYGVHDAMVDVGDVDKEYMKSIVLGHAAATVAASWWR